MRQTLCCLLVSSVIYIAHAKKVDSKTLRIANRVHDDAERTNPMNEDFADQRISRLIEREHDPEADVKNHNVAPKSSDSDTSYMRRKPNRNRGPVRREEDSRKLSDDHHRARDTKTSRLRSSFEDDLDVDQEGDDTEIRRNDDSNPVDDDNDTDNISDEIQSDKKTKRNNNKEDADKSDKSEKSKQYINGEMEWSVLPHYEVTEGSHQAVLFHHVQFRAFKCLSALCQCKEMELVIKTGSTHQLITRKLSGSCESGFDIMSIVPGLGYEYEITPKIVMEESGTTLTAKTKSFTVYNEMDPLISSFQIVFKWSQQDWDLLGNGNIDSQAISKTLKEEISVLTKLESHFINIHIDESLENAVKVHIMVSKVDDSTKPQTAIEMIRNMFYKPLDNADAVNVPLLSKITTLKTKMAISSVKGQRGRHDEIRNGQAARRDIERRGSLGFNYGALFFCSIMIGVCCFLLSKCSKEQLLLTLEFTKTVCFKIMEGIKMLIDSARASNTAGDEKQYDTVEMTDSESSSKDKKDKSGLKLLNKICRDQGVPGFKRSTYVQKLKDQHITSLDQIRQLNTSDWAGFGIPKNVVQIIQTKSGVVNQDSLPSVRSGETLSSVKYQFCC